MNRILVGLLVSCLACGSVDDRPACSVSADCSEGEFCAAAEGERFCFPDSTPPSVSAPTVTCPVPCVRDATLTVATTATDPDGDAHGTEPLRVEVTLDVDPGRVFPMTRQGSGSYRATVNLAEVAFPHFSRAVVATVTARNGRGPSAASTASGGNVPTVTRLRWSADVASAATALTHPAVLVDGTAVAGGSDGKVYFVAASGTPGVAPVVGSGTITSPPSVGSGAVWVGSADGSVYGIGLDGGALSAARSCATNGAVQGPPAVSGAGASEVVFVASGGGRVWSLSVSTGACGLTLPTDAFSFGPVIDAFGAIFAANTSAASASHLRKYIFDGGAFGLDWSSAIGTTTSAPLAVDAQGAVWSQSSDRALRRTTSDGTTTALDPLPAAPTDGAVILSTGDLVVGDAAGTLRRLTPAGATVWATSLGSPVLSPLVLSGGAALLVTATKDGRVHAVAADGTVLWSGTVAATGEPRSGNVFTAPGARTSTAYFATSNGKLHAVAVDGALDPASPWPKVHHDPRNTGNVATAY